MGQFLSTCHDNQFFTLTGSWNKIEDVVRRERPSFPLKWTTPANGDTLVLVARNAYSCRWCDHADKVPSDILATWREVYYCQKKRLVASRLSIEIRIFDGGKKSQSNV